MKRIGNFRVFGTTLPLYELEEQKMSNYFMLDGKKIPMSDETAKSLQKEQETYEVGDCFKVSDYKVMLVTCQHGVFAACLNNGNFWKNAIDVKELYAITSKELDQILGSDNCYKKITLRIEEN